MNAWTKVKSTIAMFGIDIVFYIFEKNTIIYNSGIRVTDL